MAYWLLKSEPSAFSIDDLAQAPMQTAMWDGVRNYQARNFLKAMQLGDAGLFYHSSCAVPAIVGELAIVRTAYPDPTALDSANHHYDPRSTQAQPRWVCVDVQLVRRWQMPLTLAQLHQSVELADFTLLKRGNRLSVLPVTAQQWVQLLALRSQ
jgi:predicted RNA-binding protein with PUA-like domain